MARENRGDRKQELQQSEERYRLLVDSVRDYAIFMLDSDGVILTWSAGAQRFKAYLADEIIGQHFSRFYPSEALASYLGRSQHKSTLMSSWFATYYVGNDAGAAVPPQHKIQQWL